MTDFFFETSIRKLKEASENNKLVVFVGAGVSANSGVPTWGQLVKEFAKDLGDFDVNNSSDLYLKIPQYYFNERGEKEYFDKLNDVFHKKKYKTNPIHKEIFKLNPTHIITTNYDTLLEEAAIEEGHFFHTVKHNLDLPYANFNKTIVKMHGDFENRNIVLKEDDYLNYSSNFTLIETYIKSLIATNTVLFIGYSVNDTNFNLIFQWVKSILKNHFQPAYLFENSKSPSRIEQSYYKNRGINLLYYDEIKNIASKKMFEQDNELGNKLFDSLSYFNSFDITKNKVDIEVIYERISHLEKLNFIMPSQIVKSLDLEKVFYDLYGDKKLDLSGDNILTKVFTNHSDYADKENFKLKQIINIFKKANIQGLSSKNGDIYFIEETNTFINDILIKFIEEDSLLNTVDSKNLSNLIEDEDYHLLFKYAATYCASDKFLEAYNIYKKISLKAFQDKEYLIYYLSEFNRKHVGKFWSSHSFEIPPKIKSEIKGLNLEEIYNRLPSQERKSVAFLKEIEDFNLFYKVQSKLNRTVNSLKNTKRTIEQGGNVFGNDLNRIFNEIINIWLFVKSNHLCIERYSEVQSLYLTFMEGIFASYSTKPKQTTNMKFPRVERLELFEVYLIITKLKIKDFENLLIHYNIENLTISEEAQTYIMRMLDNISKNIATNTNRWKYEQYLYNLLSLISKSDLTIDKANEIARELLDIIDIQTYSDGSKYLNKFLVSIANKNLLQQKNIALYIEKYLEIFLRNSGNLDLSNNRVLYKNLTIIYNSYLDYPINKDLISSILILMQQLIEENNRIELYNLLEIIVIPIVSKLEETHRSTVIDFINKIIDKIKENTNSLDFKDIYIYFLAIMHELSEPNEEINKRIIEVTQKTLKRDQIYKLTPDPLIKNLNLLTDLYRKKLIKLKELEGYIEDFKGHSEYFDLFFAKGEVKFNNEKLLIYLDDDILKQRMEDVEVSRAIYKLIEESVLNLKDENSKKTFHKFYLKKY